MKAASKDGLFFPKDAPAGASETPAGDSSTDAAELLLAELRAHRKRLQQLIAAMASEEASQEAGEPAGRDLQAIDAPRGQPPRLGHRCRRASTTRGSRRAQRARRGITSGA